MARFLFWNTGGKGLEHEIGVISREHRIDLIVLAENTATASSMLNCLNPAAQGAYTNEQVPAFRLRIYFRSPMYSVEPLLDEAGIGIRAFGAPHGERILVVAVHLFSKQYRGESDQVFGAVRLADRIAEAEKRARTSKTIVVGDLNMNPFEAGMVSARGLHSVMDRRIALKKSRTVSGETSFYFYNPFWGRMGDSSAGPPGTYFYGSGNDVCYFWNTFDQVLIRPELLPRFRDESLQVLTAVGSESLLTREGRPSRARGSDHLPVVFEMDLSEEGKNHDGKPLG